MLKGRLIIIFLLVLLVISFWANVFFLSTRWYLNSVENPNMLNLINLARVVKGLPPIADNSLLDKSAHNKACDMVNNNYFSHNSPTGKTPWDFIKEAGYKYKDAGENIYKGDQGTANVMVSFMASDEHRENILKPEFREFGYGTCGDYFVLHFGDK